MPTVGSSVPLSVGVTVAAAPPTSPRPANSSTRDDMHTPMRKQDEARKRGRGAATLDAHSPRASASASASPSAGRAAAAAAVPSTADTLTHASSWREQLYASHTFGSPYAAFPYAVHENRATVSRYLEDHFRALTHADLLKLAAADRIQHEILTQAGRSKGDSALTIHALGDGAFRLAEPIPLPTSAHSSASLTTSSTAVATASSRDTSSSIASPFVSPSALIFDPSTDPSFIVPPLGIRRAQKEDAAQDIECMIATASDEMVHDSHADADLAECECSLPHLPSVVDDPALMLQLGRLPLRDDLDELQQLVEDEATRSTRPLNKSTAVVVMITHDTEAETDSDTDHILCEYTLTTQPSSASSQATLPAISDAALQPSPTDAPSGVYSFSLASFCPTHALPPLSSLDPMWPEVESLASLRESQLELQREQDRRDQAERQKQREAAEAQRLIDAERTVPSSHRKSHGSSSSASVTPTPTPIPIALTPPIEPTLMEIEPAGTVISIKLEPIDAPVADASIAGLVEPSPLPAASDSTPPPSSRRATPDPADPDQLLKELLSLQVQLGRQTTANQVSRDAILSRVQPKDVRSYRDHHDSAQQLFLASYRRVARWQGIRLTMQRGVADVLLPPAMLAYHRSQFQYDLETAAAVAEVDSSAATLDAYIDTADAALALTSAHAPQTKSTVELAHDLAIESDEFNDYSVCSVCFASGTALTALDEEDQSVANMNPLVFCARCNVCVHLLCYGITGVPEGEWTCQWCDAHPEPPAETKRTSTPTSTLTVISSASPPASSTASTPSSARLSPAESATPFTFPLTSPTISTQAPSLPSVRVSSDSTLDTDSSPSPDSALSSTPSTPAEGQVRSASKKGDRSRKKHRAQESAAEVERAKLESEMAREAQQRADRKRREEEEPLPCCLCTVRGGALKPTDAFDVDIADYLSYQSRWSRDGLPAKMATDPPRRLWAHIVCALWLPRTNVSDVATMDCITGVQSAWKFRSVKCGAPVDADSAAAADSAATEQNPFVRHALANPQHPQPAKPMRLMIDADAQSQTKEASSHDAISSVVSSQFGVCGLCNKAYGCSIFCASDCCSRSYHPLCAWYAGLYMRVETDRDSTHVRYLLYCYMHTPLPSLGIQIVDVTAEEQSVKIESLAPATAPDPCYFAPTAVVLSPSDPTSVSSFVSLFASRNKLRLLQQREWRHRGRQETTKRAKLARRKRRLRLYGSHTVSRRSTRTNADGTTILDRSTRGDTKLHAREDQYELGRCAVCFHTDQELRAQQNWQHAKAWREWKAQAQEAISLGFAPPPIPARAPTTMPSVPEKKRKKDAIPPHIIAFYDADPLVRCSECEVEVHAKCYGVQYDEVAAQIQAAERRKSKLQRVSATNATDATVITPASLQTELDELHAQFEDDRYDSLEESSSSGAAASWRCRRCADATPAKDISCALCFRKGGAFKRTDTDSWVHLVCAQWFPECAFADEYTLEPVTGLDEISPARRRLKCYLCKRAGPCIECSEHTCGLAFHPLCGMLSGQLMMEIHDSANSCTFLASCRRHTQLHLARFIPLPQDYTNLVWAKKKMENARVIIECMKKRAEEDLVAVQGHESRDLQLWTDKRAACASIAQTVSAPPSAAPSPSSRRARAKETPNVLLPGMGAWADPNNLMMAAAAFDFMKLAAMSGADKSAAAVAASANAGFMSLMFPGMMPMLTPPMTPSAAAAAMHPFHAIHSPTHSTAHSPINIPRPSSQPLAMSPAAPVPVTRPASVTAVLPATAEATRPLAAVAAPLPLPASTAAEPTPDASTAPAAVAPLSARKRRSEAASLLDASKTPKRPKESASKRRAKPTATEEKEGANAD